MSISTDAILFYGFLIDEDLSPPWYDPEDEDDEYDSESDEGDGEDPTSWAYWKTLYVRGKGVDYDKEFSKAWDILEKAKCEIGVHCSDSCPMFYVTIKKSVIEARRGYPEEVDPNHVKKIKSEWDKQLREFCAGLGIAPPKKFGWFLVSYWEQ